MLQIETPRTPFANCSGVSRAYWHIKAGFLQEIAGFVTGHDSRLRAAKCRGRDEERQVSDSDLAGWRAESTRIV